MVRVCSHSCCLRASASDFRESRLVPKDRREKTGRPPNARESANKADQARARWPRDKDERQREDTVRIGFGLRPPSLRRHPCRHLRPASLPNANPRGRRFIGAGLDSQKER